MRILTAIALAAVVAAGSHSTAQAQDAAAGERVFQKCRACHQVGPTARNGVGPVLNGIFGRQAGSVAGFNYSPANKNSGVTWTPEVFDQYITNPRAFMPGNRMAFAGLPSEQERKDIMAFLKQFDASGNKQ